MLPSRPNLVENSGNTNHFWEDISQLQRCHRYHVGTPTLPLSACVFDGNL